MPTCEYEFVLEHRDGKRWWGADDQGENPGWVTDEQNALLYGQTYGPPAAAVAVGVWKCWKQVREEQS